MRDGARPGEMWLCTNVPITTLTFSHIKQGTIVKGPQKPRCHVRDVGFRTYISDVPNPNKGILADCWHPALHAAVVPRRIIGAVVLREASFRLVNVCFSVCVCVRVYVVAPRNCCYHALLVVLTITCRCLSLVGARRGRWPLKTWMAH